jgi:hypothetical protein
MASRYTHLLAVMKSVRRSFPPVRLNVFQQTLHGRTVHVAAGESAVVVTVGQADPALVLHARDVRLGAFALRVQRVELLL